MTAVVHGTGAPAAGPEDLARSEKILADALFAFDTTLTVLRDAVEAFRAERDRGEKEVISDLKAMNSAYLFALQMQEKARAAGSKYGGGAGVGELDLDRAREEIGVRMACLRDVRTDGCVSGELE